MHRTFRKISKENVDRLSPDETAPSPKRKEFQNISRNRRKLGISFGMNEVLYFAKCLTQ
jgi:hypothetical protein